MEFVEAVLAVVRLVPAGSAVSYGDIAELLGSGGARQVGAVMSRHGSNVPWWRVVKASGQAPEGHEADALLHYLEEGMPLTGDYTYCRSSNASWRVDLAVGRWAPGKDDYERIDAVGGGLRPRQQELSEADDGMLP